MESQDFQVFYYGKALTQKLFLKMYIGQNLEKLTFFDVLGSIHNEKEDSVNKLNVTHSCIKITLW